MYEKVTRSIRVRVEPRYLDERSAPDEGLYFWAYDVEIANEGGEAVQLRARSWRITDETGRVETVRGKGVVGEQPLIEPGQRFAYTSGCPLRTPSGFMVGSYEMETARGERFHVEIPAFSLDQPGPPRTMN
jgi:ApaG protein